MLEHHSQEVCKTVVGSHLRSSTGDCMVVACKKVENRDRKGKSLEGIVALKGALPVERLPWNTDQDRR